MSSRLIGIVMLLLWVGTVRNVPTRSPSARESANMWEIREKAELAKSATGTDGRPAESVEIQSKNSPTKPPDDEHTDQSAKAETEKPNKSGENECDVSKGVDGTTGENGITVGRTKVFDNRTLTLMLETLADTLRGLQVVDQDPLKKALGLLQGSQTHDVSRSFSVMAGGTPKVVTTNSSSNQTDTENQTTTASGTKDDKVTKDYVQNLVDQKVSDKLGLNRETTVSERNPTLPTIPDLISAPTGAPGFGQNPVDLLTDQVNLTYQIFNIRMLLDRSLSDRLLSTGAPRLQTVLGFNISIDPPRDAEEAAAVVEITIKAQDGVPVSLVSMMPQEKTYNSVALSTKSNAFGGSAVVKMVTIGYSERRRGQIFYLFRDNDTLSFERMMTKNGTLTFGWQFRPVLGRKAVAPGMRQMFAVISMPTSDAAGLDENKQLNVSVRTYWRKYYSGTLTSANKDDIGPWPYVRRALSLGTANSVPNGKIACRRENKETDVIVPTTAKYQDDLKPKVTGVRWTQLDEKSALISVKGENFFTGTTVALGGSDSGTKVIIKSNQAMDIVTPIENIGSGDAMVIGRYGTAQPLDTTTDCSLMVQPGSRLSLPFGGQRELDLKLKGCCISDLDQQLVVFANGKHVPGRPQVFEQGEILHVITSIPVDLFPKTEGVITVVNPFRGPSERAQFIWYENPYELRRIKGDGKTVIFIRRLDGVSFKNEAFGTDPKWKVQFAGQTFSPKFDSTDVLQVELPGVDASGALALFEPVGNKTDDTNPYVLELPTTQPKPKTPVEAASGTELVLGQNDAPKLEFTGEKIGDVATVIIEGKTPLRKEYDSEKKILSVYLTQEITKLPAKLTVQFRDIAGKLIATLPLEIKALRKPGTSTDKLSCLSWNWRGRSSVKITERTHEKRAKTLHCGREGCHSEAAPVG